jgi:hypothetical protein
MMFGHEEQVHRQEKSDPRTAISMTLNATNCETRMGLKRNLAIAVAEREQRTRPRPHRDGTSHSCRIELYLAKETYDFLIASMVAPDAVLPTGTAGGFLLCFTGGAGGDLRCLGAPVVLDDAEEGEGLGGCMMGPATPAGDLECENANSFIDLPNEACLSGAAFDAGGERPALLRDGVMRT